MANLKLGKSSVQKLNRATALSLFLLLCPLALSQVAAPKPTATQESTEPTDDAIGRNTPRGTVIGFLNAFRKDEMEIAVLYLDVP